MSQLKLFCFGPPRLERNGQVVEVTLRKSQALLVYLVVTGTAHSRETLATLFWPETDTSAGRANLRRALYRVNKALEEDLFTVVGDTIAIDADADLWVDVVAFRDTLNTDPSRHRLLEAVELYSDEFLAGFTLPDAPTFDEWQFFEREELRRSLAQTLVELVDAYQEEEAWEAATSAARRWLALDSLHEPAHRRLIVLYALAGQQAAALRQYHECVRLLDEELGVAPEAETTRLFEAIRRRELTPSPTEETSREEQAGGAGKQQLGNAARPNLPTQQTPFIGRDNEVGDAVGRLVDPTCRLLTLVGPGGIGKTRLAVEVARQAAPSFVDGIYFVNLQAVQAADFLVSTIADALQIPLAGAHDPEIQLLGYLRGKALLLLLDNFEHLLSEQAIAFLTRVLATAPGVRLLVTSREALNMLEEWRFPLQGLPVPPSAGIDNLLAYGAVELFVERAVRMQPGFSLDEERAGVVRICQLVEGMPLALELAASWLATLRPLAIAVEIQQRLNFLSTSLRDVPTRHRSMRAVFDHSWKLLDEDEQNVFTRLSVFRGGFRRQAAQKVADASLVTLSVLVDKSLIRRELEGRYQIHELLRQYGEEYLEHSGKAGRTRDRHSEYYLQEVAEREVVLKGRRQLKALDEIEADFENTRAAWQRAVIRYQVPLLAKAAWPLWYFLDIRGHYHQALTLFDQVLDMLQALRTAEPENAFSEIELGRMLAYRAFHLTRLGQTHTARSDLEQAVSLLRLHTDKMALVDALWIYSMNCWFAGNFPEGIPAVQEAVTLTRALEQPWHLACSCVFLGVLLHEQGELDEAYRALSECLSISRTLGDPRAITFATTSLSRTAQALGQYQEMLAALQEGLELARQMGDPTMIGLTLEQLAHGHHLMGERAEAYRFFRESLTLFRETEDLWSRARVLNAMGHIALEQDTVAEAEQSFAEAFDAATAANQLANAMDSLAGLASVRSREGAAEAAMELAAYVHEHPASTEVARAQASSLRANLSNQLTLQQMEAAEIKARSTTFDAWRSGFART